MLTKTALDHFNGSRKAVASILGLTRSAVYQWRDIVPLASANQLQRITGGKLKVDMACYDERTLNPIRKPSDTTTAAA